MSYRRSKVQTFKPANVQTIPTHLSVFLDAVRWLAALAVVGGHLRSLLFVNYPLIEHKSILLRAFYFVTGFGHQAVVVFFVMSGFLIGRKAIQEAGRGRFSVVGYLVNRVSRIYPVLIVALIAGGALDWVGLHYLNQVGLYDHSYSFDLSVLDYSVADRLSIPVFLGNLIMGQNILVTTFGSNAPLWFLGNLFWYYVLFALIMWLWTGQGLRNKLVPALLLLCLVILLPAGLLLLFPAWLLGVLVAAVRRPLVRRVAIPVLILGAVLFAARAGWLPDTYAIGDFLVAAAFALFLHTVATTTQRSLPAGGLHHRLAGFSYSLYVMHFPMMVLVAAALYRFLGVELWTQPGVRGALLYLLVLGFLYLYGYAAARLVEGNTHVVRRGLNRILGIQQA